MVAFCALAHSVYSNPLCSIDSPLTLWAQTADYASLQDSGYMGDLIQGTDSWIEPVGRIYGHADATDVADATGVVDAVDIPNTIRALFTTVHTTYREALEEQSMGVVDLRYINPTREQIITLAEEKKSSALIDAIAELPAAEPPPTDELSVAGPLSTAELFDAGFPDAELPDAELPPAADYEADIVIGDDSQFTLVADDADQALAAAEQSRFHLLIVITGLRGERQVVTREIDPPADNADTSADISTETGATSESISAPETADDASTDSENRTDTNGTDASTETATEEQNVAENDDSDSINTQPAFSQEVSYLVFIEVDTIAINTRRNRIKRTSTTIPVVLADQSSVTDIQAAIKDSVEKQLIELRDKAVLLQKHNVLYRDRSNIFLDNNGYKIPLGYEFVPLLASEESCTRGAARTVFRTVESYQNFALLRNTSGTLGSEYTTLLADPTGVIIENHLGYVFPISFRRTQVLAPTNILVGGVQLSPGLNFGLIRPFFQTEVHVVIDQIDTYTPVAAMGGIELVWHIGALTFKPSLAGGVAAGIGISRNESPFFLAAFGGSLKLFAGINITRKFVLFIEGGYTQWITAYTTATELLRTNAYVLSVGYGGVELSAGLSIKP